MRRAAIERPFVERMVRRWRSLSSWNRLDDFPANKFRKLKPGSCGQPGCLKCHGEKIFQRPTNQEKRARANAKDYGAT